MAGASEGSFYGEKKSIREISIMLLKSEKSIYRYLKNCLSTSKKRKKEKANSQKRKAYQKAMGQAKQGRKDTQISLAEKVSEGSMT